MKKTIALLLVFCLLTMLTACSKSPDAASSSVWEETVIQTNAASTQNDAQTNDTAATDKQSAVATHEGGAGGKTTSEQQSSDKTVAADTKVTTTRTREQRTITTARTRTTRSTTAKATTTKKTTTSFVRRTTVKRTYPAAEDIVVTCVGDSITFNGYWQSNMQNCLSDRYTVKGYGVNGSTAMFAGYDNSSPKAYIDQIEYGASRNSNPDIVVIMLGTNDSKTYNWSMEGNENAAMFKADLITLVQSYQLLDSEPTVILATPPAAYVTTYGSISPDNIVNEVIPAVKEVASLTGCRVADTYSATVNANWQVDFKDGIHPSTSAGRKVIAQAIADVIKAETGVA